VGLVGQVLLYSLALGEGHTGQAGWGKMPVLK